MTYDKFIKDVGLIGITQVLTTLGAFFLLPIITKTLGSYDYGIWSQINVTVSLLTPFALLGLSMSIVRFMSAEKDVNVIRETFYSVLFFVALTSMLISILVFVISDWLASFLFQDINTSYFIKIGSFLIFFSALNQITMFYFRIFRQISKYAFLSIFNSFGGLVLILILVKMGFGLFGVISAALLVQLFVIVVGILLITSQIGFSVPKFTYLHSHLKYGLPLAPNSAVRWITSSSDKYILGFFMGLNAVGIYAAAYAIGNIISFFVSPIQLMLFPTLSKAYDMQNLSEVNGYLEYSLKYFLLFAIPSAFGISVLAKPILRMMTTAEFVSGSIVIPFVAFGIIFEGVYQISINVTHLVKKTQYNIVFLSIGAISNLLLNIILIPIFGLVGAAVSTLIAYFLMCAVSVFFSQKYIQINIDWLLISKIILSSLLMALVVHTYNPETFIGIIIAIGLGFIIYCLLIILLKGVEIRELKSIIHALIPNNRAVEVSDKFQ
ncbi:polysaccharide biosynthesis protein [Methanosarcina siciliae T4/M]|uniref:Polysaccharide biosynthesis protein n=1 Tax=Methanosarcina siciliae T4/M TaxID=1434120 RepID=A0A0E3P7T0_9EURY|nr:flippase [Methanosarcina siciliae]AKB29885.1 polysaccharide biosynthesis protein [Methanosarcina siciliae T4/M]